MDEVQIVGSSKYKIPSSESHRTSCLLYNIIVSSKLAQSIPLQTSIIFFWNETWHCLRLLETIPRVVQITAVQLAAFHPRCTTQLTQQQPSALQHNHTVSGMMQDQGTAWLKEPEDPQSCLTTSRHCKWPPPPPRFSKANLVCISHLHRAWDLNI